jgi:hypothetical protein
VCVTGRDRESATACRGPERITTVYTHGSDERGPSVEQLTEAVARTEAVINVVQTRGDDLWSHLVGRTGGVVLRTGTAEVVQSYGRLVTALGEQYLVEFQGPVSCRRWPRSRSRPGMCSPEPS